MELMKKTLTMNNKIPAAYRKKKLIVFDMDGTLTPSKSIADKAMANLLLQLLEEKKIAVIGGGKYSLFKEQHLKRLPRRDPRLAHLFLFPTTSNAFYRYHKTWKNVYTLSLSKNEKTDIRNAFREVLKAIDYVPERKIYGVTLEDRGTQMSWSPLGQDIVGALGKKGIHLKEKWKRQHNPLRFKIAKLLAKKLPKLEIHVGGLTTIDITRKGIDKAYGVRQIKKMLKIRIKDMLFIGDALYPGGNDYAAKKTGIQCLAVNGPENTKRIIEQIIAE
jgi:HAD superfamily hydrolase (TIGR01484 family)